MFLLPARPAPHLPLPVHPTDPSPHSPPATPTAPPPPQPLPAPSAPALLSSHRQGALHASSLWSPAPICFRFRGVPSLRAAADKMVSAGGSGLWVRLHLLPSAPEAARSARPRRRPLR